MRCGLVFLGLLVLTATAVPAAPDGVPTLLHYQGRLQNPGGLPLAGPVTMTFGLYPVASAGSPLWTETHEDVILTDGVASVLLGSLNALPENAFSAPGRYLQITVDGTVLSPRLVLASVPYAFEAERLEGMAASDFEPAGAVSSLAESDTTPPNEGSNAIHWDNLAGVPEGFADGVDAGGGAVDHGDLTGLEDDDHPQYLLRTEAGTTDTDPPNQGANLVHWDNLTGVPEGLADGVDDLFSGQVGELTGAEIQDSTLTGVDLAPGSLTGENLAPGSITADRLALESLTGDQILDDGIRSADILDNTITGSDVQDNSLTAADLAEGSVTSSEILDGSITEDDVSFVPGDITAVLAGPGLLGGGENGQVSLSVSAGSGISVSGSSVSLAPSYLSGSAYDSRFVSRTSPTWNVLTAAVTAAGAVFRPVTNTGKFTVVPGDGTLSVDSADNGGAEDEFTAPIQLPHGASVAAFRVSYWDNSQASLEVSLWRARQNGAGSTRIASITTAGAASSWRTDSDITITESLVDNLEYHYWLEADFPTTPQGTSLRLLGATVEYTTTKPH